MEIITFEEFYEHYKPKRNPINLNANYENTMIDFDDEGEDLVFEQGPNTVWTLTQERAGLFLDPGIKCTNDTLGFFICKETWSNEKGYILK